MPDPLDIHRGDVLWIDCEPSVGVEPRKVRTCIVVSNDRANALSAAVTVIPTLRFSAERASRPFMVDLRAPRSTLDQPRVANAAEGECHGRQRRNPSDERLRSLRGHQPDSDRVVVQQHTLTAADAVEVLAGRLGALLISLGVMHFLNIYIFHRLRRRGEHGLAPLPSRLGSTAP